MTPSIKRLLVLQQAHLRLAQLHRQLMAMPAERERLQKGAQEAQAAEDDARARLRQAEADLRRLEMDTETLRQRKRDFQTKTAIIRNNDEYRAALDQIAQCDRGLDDLENRQLATMERLDQLRQELERQTQLTQEAQRGAQAAIDQLAAQEADLAERIAAQKARPPALKQGIDPDFLRESLRLRTSPATPQTRPVLVPIVGEACGACHLNVTAQLCANARAGRSIVCCPSCHLMLYWDGD